ncbi:MAG: alpha/beta hydrolase [Chloroflexi bacterium]|nr:MAG: alpha/beta hydrolase [Chloroflexota bacterium]MBL1195136.1 alpha/beta hydrolase [Chloroflexota bacterium]NOH12421.1 alpha/beta hydrolase [Chloroflexota bacterium]
MNKTILISIILSFVITGCGEVENPDATPIDSLATPTNSLAAPTSTQIPTEAPKSVSYSIPYAEVSPFQKLDVFLPTTGDGPYPTFIAMHGGGFAARSKALYQQIAREYASQGYAFVSINYRLTNKASYPAQVEDSFCALAWLHANAEIYGFDTERVIAMGDSAGGYLASMLGTVDDPSIYLNDCPHEYPSGDALQGVVVFYGLYDFTSIEGYPANDVRTYLTPFWGDEYENLSIEIIEEMSPLIQIDGSEPPFIIFHGTADTRIPSSMSEQFAKTLEQAGVDVELVLMPDVKHAFIQPITRDEMVLALDKINAFLERVITE